MKIKNFKIECPNCNGNGYGSFVEEGFNYKSGCKSCGGDGDQLHQKRNFLQGRGFIIKKLEVLDEECEHCEGVGKIELETFTHKKGLFGEYRKVKRHKEKCPQCLGQGQRLAIISKVECPDCEGTGKETFWGKGLFGKEYKKYKTCQKCLGDGEIEKKSSYQVQVAA